MDVYVWSTSTVFKLTIEIYINIIIIAAALTYTNVLYFVPKVPRTAIRTI